MNFKDLFRFESDKESEIVFGGISISRLIQAIKSITPEERIIIKKFLTDIMPNNVGIKGGEEN